MTTHQTQVGIRSKVSCRLAPYVVVSNPGTMFARIEAYCTTLRDAQEGAREYDDPVDVMKVAPSGALTTEF